MSEPGEGRQWSPEVYHARGKCRIKIYKVDDLLSHIQIKPPKGEASSKEQAQLKQLTGYMEEAHEKLAGALAKKGVDRQS